jgi:hypothetical protein
MRLAALTLLALSLAASVATGAVGTPGESFEVKDGRGTVQVTGTGALVGRIDKGSLKIVDLSPSDQWSPYVNGVPRGKVVWLKGRNIGFRVSKGRYLVIAKGEGISISAYGTGAAVVDGEPDQTGNTGAYRIGDSQGVPLPADPLKLAFGTPDGSTPSSASGKIPQ